jgi:putative endonuclease
VRLEGWVQLVTGAYLYLLRCSDGRYYTGTARSGLEQRIAEHNAGAYDGYTAMRRPVTLVYSEWFDQITGDCGRTAGEGLVARKEGSADSGRFRSATRTFQAPQFESKIAGRHPSFETLYQVARAT